ncbi:25125_t:CDS:2 [Dentiscutata erythropus]|uniref:25125_t:CDS:1 n=1 Tax=Dentiscutata erythropus TaxID=1348616 RepID=A0A9N9CMH7_9GLOM|nr:25125_t:CDS:2 [Dentiscutata erythropus]
MGHTQSSEGVDPSLDKSSELNKSKRQTFSSVQSSTDDELSHYSLNSKGKSTNFTPDTLNTPDQPFFCRTPSSVTSLNDDCDSSESSYRIHSRSQSTDIYYDNINNKRFHRSYSLPSNSRRPQRHSSYLSHCSLYSESRDEPLRWKKAHKRQSILTLQQQIPSYLSTEPNSIPYSYKEAMDIICGEKNYLSNYQESDDDFCDSTPSTSVTALSSVNDDITEELLLLDPKSLFGSEPFYSLPETHVLYLIKRDDVGGHTEVEIWRCLVEWGKRNTPKFIFNNDINKWSKKDFESLARTLRNCIYWIRFLQMTPIEFQTFVMPYQYIIPKFIIGNFLRQKITDHPQTSMALAPARIPMTPIDSTIITGRHATILNSRRASTLSLSRRNSMNKKREESAQGNCFIFSFEDTYYPEQTAIISRVIPEFKKDAIKVKNKWGGPCFGRGDLWVCPDKKNKSLYIRPTSYEIPIIDSEDVNFKWVDFEVFQVLDQ